jgi:hypothetical protein
LQLQHATYKKNRKNALGWNTFLEMRDEGGRLIAVSEKGRQAAWREMLFDTHEQCSSGFVELTVARNGSMAGDPLKGLQHR